MRLGGMLTNYENPKPKRVCLRYPFRNVIPIPSNIMKTVQCFKNLFAIAFIPFAFGGSLFAQDEDETGGYLFFGTEVSALVGKSNFPMVTMDKKNIYVDIGTEVKKISLRSPCAVRTELVLTERFVDVLEMKFNTSSMENIKRAARAVSDMHVAEFQSEVEIARIQGFGGMPAEDLSEADTQRIDDIRQDNDDFQTGMQEGLDQGAFEADELADTVHVNGTIIPKTDVEGGYCIVVVDYDRQDLNTGEIEGRGRFARARFIGDMYEEEIVRLNVRCAVGEFNTETAVYSLFLFDKDGDQVAMSNSRGLKPLTVMEVKLFRELAAKTALNRES